MLHSLINSLWNTAYNYHNETIINKSKKLAVTFEVSKVGQMLAMCRQDSFSQAWSHII